MPMTPWWSSIHRDRGAQVVQFQMPCQRLEPQIKPARKAGSFEKRKKPLKTWLVGGFQSFNPFEKYESSNHATPNSWGCFHFKKKLSWNHHRKLEDAACFFVDRGPKDSPIVIMSLRVDHLGKIHKAEISGQMEYYFTNLGFPEIRRCPLTFHHHLGWGNCTEIWWCLWGLWGFHD